MGVHHWASWRQASRSCGSPASLNTSPQFPFFGSQSWSLMRRARRSARWESVNGRRRPCGSAKAKRTRAPHPSSNPVQTQKRYERIDRVRMCPAFGEEGGHGPDGWRSRGLGETLMQHCDLEMIQRRFTGLGIAAL